MGVAIDPQKNIYFTDYHLHSLRRIDIKERTVSTIGGTGTGGMIITFDYSFVQGVCK
jgi:hypothetical protein